MAHVITAPESLEGISKSIFLAGSIDMNKAVDWQKEMISKFADDDFVILNPRRADFDPNLPQEPTNPVFAEQVTWEMDALDKADVIAFYFDPNGKAPITLMELGLHAQSRKVIVCCPEGYWRRGNVQMLCQRYDIPTVDTLDELIEATRDKIAICGTSVIDFDLDNDLLLQSALLAHEQNITLNQHLVNALTDMIKTCRLTHRDSLV